MNKGKVSLDVRNFSKGALNFAINATDVLVSIVSSLFLLGGALATAFADVVLGAITLNLMFVNQTGVSIRGIELAPFMVSLGASGIQLILWKLIQREGISNIFKNKNGAMIASLAFVIVLKFADDFMDVSSVSYLVVGSSLYTILGATYFFWLKISVMFITWVLTGFSEIFIANAIPALRTTEKKSESKPNNPPKSPYTPKHRPDFSHSYKNELLNEIYKKDA